MTEAEFVELVCEIRQIPKSSWPDTVIENSPFDSLDLLEIRAALESRLNMRLSDEKFVASTTLRDLYDLVKHG